VLLSSVDLVKNSTILQNRLQNESYFQAQVTGDTVVKNKTGKAVYTVHAGPGYLIRKVTFPSGTRSIDTAVAGTGSQSLLKVGDKYNLDVIKNERLRIDARLKEEGFYYFAPEDLIARVDSNAKDHHVDIYVSVKNTISGLATKIYDIRNIYVYPDYSLKDTSRKLESAVKYRWYNVIDPKHTVRPFVFKNTVLLHPGDVYNRTKHNGSLNRFIELGPFKSVNNRFEAVSQDSSYLDLYYFLTQYKRKSLQAEVQARQTSANFSGTQFNLTFRNRNTFKGAELFTLNFFVSNDLQFGHTSNNHSVYQFGVQPSISWPRIIGPFNFSPNNAFIPRTILQTGYTLIDRTGLYRLNSFNASIGYQWKPTLHTQHELTLFGVTYVDAANVSKLYRDSILKTRNPALAHVINNQFTFGPSYSYTFTNTTEEFRTNTYYFMSRLSLSGNLYGILTGADTPRRVSKIFNTPFNQYLKIENEARFFHKLGPNNKLATRLIVDVGLPYGNSTVMPYSQQFFIAGANSLRGFQARSIGPGAYNVPDALRQGTNFLPDESGDIKLEANVELRPKLFSILEGALFVDAGNIWLLHPNKYVPGGAFGKNFINQIAADAGAGLRLNLSVLILRGDIGFPIIKPSLPAGQHIVINQIDFGSSKWRGQNLIFNLAIGYPF
jgi:outer membrane protein insertion porin family